MINNSDPKTKPWGTPYVLANVKDVASLIYK